MTKVGKVVSPQKKKTISAPSVPTPDFEKLHVAFCLRDIDRNQGCAVTDWANSGLLEKMVNKIVDVSCLRMEEAKLRRAVKVYGEFPQRSKFTHPNHVTQDAQWASMHIQGKQCLAGHVERNVFHVVFLDTEHGFFPSKFKGKNPNRRSQS